MAKIAVTLRKSTIGFPKTHGRIVESLGLRRLNQTVMHEDRPSIRGMIFKVKHLLEVAKTQQEE